MAPPGFPAFLRSRRTPLLSVFLAAETAVLAFVLAQQAWPRAIPEAVGWAIFGATYPWSLPWLSWADTEPGLTMAALAACFGLNVTLAAALAWYVAARRARVE